MISKRKQNIGKETDLVIIPRHIMTSKEMFDVVNKLFNIMLEVIQ